MIPKIVLSSYNTSNNTSVRLKLIEVDVRQKLFQRGVTEK